ncbi:MAG TPA: Abi family protein [Candidatus Paenibacillus intestinavium]|nr:Abi family protein [Candidatus Paenibacillus intestinavium]
MSSEKDRISLKWPTTYKQQIDLLLSRGVVIEDVEQATTILKHISYYRLTAYGLSLKQEGSDNYIANTSFEHIYRLYEFDSKLRALLMSR